MTADLPIRPATDADWDDISRLLYTAFHAAFDLEEAQAEREAFEPARSLLATDGDQVVGHAGAFTRSLGVPGGVVPAAHVSMVGVASTHRRRGLLTRLMQRQLRDIRAAGREPVAVLWASEGRIYPRFGYGLASLRVDFEIDTREVRLPASAVGTQPGRLRAGTPDVLRTDMTKLHEEISPDRPGWSSRDERWWTYVLADHASRRSGATELRAVVHEGPSGPTGYALWRTKGDWDAAGPCGEVRVGEVVAADAGTYANLWNFLLSIDLTRTVRFRFGAVDEPLLHLVGEPRRLGSRLGDGLWVRVVDVPRALAARRYATAVDVVIDITDPLLPENTGRWRLTGGPAGATCRRTDEPADLTCTVTELGAAYLGGTTLAALAAAGRIREPRPGALAATSAAFGWHRAPSAIEMF